MGKRIIIINGQVFRWRRGQLVEIPPEWVGHTTAAQTINKRQSKQPRKLRRFVESPGNAMGRNVKPGAGSRTHARRAAINEDPFVCSRCHDEEVDVCVCCHEQLPRGHVPVLCAACAATHVDSPAECFACARGRAFRARRREETNE